MSLVFLSNCSYKKVNCNLLRGGTPYSANDKLSGLAILRILLRKWADFVDKWKWGSVVKIPYSVFLIAVGMILAVIGRSAPEVSLILQYSIYLIVFYLRK